MIREVSSTLPIIDQLHNDKHWDWHRAGLEKFTGINFRKAYCVRIKDILAKDLNKYGDEITEVAECASD
jgi:hypothetical protein